MSLKQQVSRLPFFPIPAPGETVYSLTGRFMERTGLSQIVFNKLVSENCNQSPFKSEFTTYIDRLPPLMPLGHPWTDCRLIIRNHSILPYYTYFDSLERSLEWESKFTDFAETNTKKRRRISWFTNTCRFPRYCPACAREDNKQLGFSYFRREHQLHGVAVCWKHGEILSHGCKVCGAYQFNNRAFKMPGNCFCKSGVTPLSAFRFPPQLFDSLLWLAKQNAFVVSSTRPRVSNFFSGLRLIAMKNGYIEGCRETSVALAKTIEGHYGHDFLDYLGVKLFENSQPAPWIRRFLLRNPAADMKRNTLPYILMTGTMFQDVSEFEREALKLMETEKDYFINQGEAIRAGVDEDRVLKHRSVFIEFMQKHPDANLTMVKSEIANSYNFLVGSDSDWPPLKSIKPEVLNSGPKRQRMCKHQLDMDKAAELELFFDEMYAKSGKPVRITRTMAIRTVGLRFHYKYVSEFLVNVNKVINQRLESDDEFIKRKIRWAISELLQIKATISKTAVVTKAGISRDQLQHYESYALDQIKVVEIGKIGVISKPVTATQLQLF